MIISKRYRMARGIPRPSILEVPDFFSLLDSPRNRFYHSSDPRVLAKIPRGPRTLKIWSKRPHSCICVYMYWLEIFIFKCSKRKFSIFEVLGKFWRGLEEPRSDKIYSSGNRGVKKGPGPRGSRDEEFLVPSLLQVMIKWYDNSKSVRKIPNNFLRRLMIAKASWEKGIWYWFWITFDSKKWFVFFYMPAVYRSLLF